MAWHSINQELDCLLYHSRQIPLQGLLTQMILLMQRKKRQNQIQNQIRILMLNQIQVRHRIRILRQGILLNLRRHQWRWNLECQGV